MAHVTARGYLLTWVALLALTTGTFFASRAPVGGWDVVIALGFATAKSLLVLLVFMHLIEQRFSTRFIMAVAVVYVTLLVVGVVADVATRHNTFFKPPAGAPLSAPAGATAP